MDFPVQSSINYHIGSQLTVCFCSLDQHLFLVRYLAFTIHVLPPPVQWDGGKVPQDPSSFLGSVRTPDSSREDSGLSSAELVYGSTLSIPGEFILGEELPPDVFLRCLHSTLDYQPLPPLHNLPPVPSTVTLEQISL